GWPWRGAAGSTPIPPSRAICRADEPQLKFAGMGEPRGQKDDSRVAGDGPTLLTGATGFVGSAVARVLAARGHRLRLLVRPTSDRRNLAGVDAELALGDLTDAGSLTRAAAGCRFVMHVAADYRFWVPD